MQKRSLHLWQETAIAFNNLIFPRREKHDYLYFKCCSGKLHTNLATATHYERGGIMSVLATSADSLCYFDARIAAELKDMNSAVLINYLLNLSLPLPEKTPWNEEEISKFFTWASKREIQLVIRNLKKRKILIPLPQSNNLVLNSQNLEQFIEQFGGEE